MAHIDGAVHHAVDDGWSAVSGVFLECSPAGWQWCPLDDPSRNLLEGAVRKLGLSARATDRILKVARTIADLDDSTALQTHHIAEAIQYRTIDRMQ